jgi:epoxyqueuosine reductase
MTPLAKAQVVKALGRRIGFDLVGVTHAEPVRRAEYYRRWLAEGYGGTMGYLRRNVPYRAEPGKLLAGARSVICVGLNYKRADGYVRPGSEAGHEVAGCVARGDHLEGGCGDASEPGPTGGVAQYARGRDYHIVLRDMLDTLLEQVRGELGETFDARVFVDTGPVLERELAVAAGLGWFGRNTCLLNGRLGSYLLLGEALTTLELAADEPVGERCGSCRRCVEACPTGALVAPYELDARRCIAYLTIEHRGAIAEELQPLMGDHVFGCDVCQQVCPYNAKAPLATHPAMTADVLPARLDLSRLVQMGAGEYRRLTRGSAATRARPSMWRRNAAIALSNAGRTAV